MAWPITPRPDWGEQWALGSTPPVRPLSPVSRRPMAELGIGVLQWDKKSDSARFTLDIVSYPRPSGSKVSFCLSNESFLIEIRRLSATRQVHI